METLNSIIVRLETFLNSKEQTNTPATLKLYNSYRDLNNQVAKRLVACEVLLHKDQKIEAVQLALQEPSLFTYVDTLLFPKRDELLSLAELYDWDMPDTLQLETLKTLRGIVSKVERLRQCISEYQRIAKGDNYQRKLILLREIIQLDPENTAHQAAIIEAEKHYLPILINEAKTCIQSQQFDRAQAIYDELKSTSWSIELPLIVLNSLSKFLRQHAEEMVKQQALPLLKQVNEAYLKRQQARLKSALDAWQAFCQQHTYTADVKQFSQIQAAQKWLIEAEAHQQRQQARKPVDPTILSPLITEYRRIAKTDQTQRKLELLRKLVSLDPENTEQIPPLLEVEHQYVTELIAEAQNCIQQKSFVRLEAIYQELTTSPWRTPIPSIVLSSIQKCIEAYHQAEIRKTAERLCEAVNIAHKALNSHALAQALKTWHAYCNANVYTPTQAQVTQIDDATAFLAAEHVKAESQKKLDEVLATLTDLMDRNKSLAKVEKVYAKATAFNLPIPDAITTRVTNYRADILKKRKSRAIIGRFFVIGGIVLILVKFIFSINADYRQALAQEQAEAICQLIDAYQLDEALSLCKDVEQRDPQLLTLPPLVNAKNKLLHSKTVEQERQAEFKRLTAAITQQFASIQPNDTPSTYFKLNSRLNALQGLVVSPLATTDEKNTVSELKNEFQSCLNTYKNTLKTRCDAYLLEAKAHTENFYALLKKEEFKQANEKLIQIQEIAQAISALFKPELENLIPNCKVITDDAIDNLPLATLAYELNSLRSQSETIQKAYKDLRNSQSLTDLDTAIANFKTISSCQIVNSLPTYSMESDYLHAILSYQQNSHAYTIPSKFQDLAYFKDMKYYQNILSAYIQFSNTIYQLNRDRYLLSAKSSKFGFIHIEHPTENPTRIYFIKDTLNIKTVGNQTTITFDNGDQTYTLTGTPENCTFYDENGAHLNATVCYPEFPSNKFDREIFLSTPEPHIQFIEDLICKRAYVTDKDFLSFGLNSIKQLWDSPALPYWKLYISQQLLPIFCNLSLLSTDNTSLINLRASLSVIYESAKKLNEPQYDNLLLNRIERWYNKNKQAIDNLASVYEPYNVMQSIFLTQGSQQVQCVGLAYNDELLKKFTYTLFSDFKHKAIDVYYVATPTGNIQWLGRTTADGKLTLPATFLSEGNGHLLFTFDTLQSLDDQLSTLKAKREQLSPAAPWKWPAFWPLNKRQ